MVGARGERAGPRGERRGGAGVRLQPPRLAGAVVDRAPHQRVAEAVAARHVGRAGDARGEQVVDRRQRVGVAEPGGGGREVEVERLAGHGAAPREQAGALGQARDLLPERGRDGRRHADGVRLLARRGGGHARARELLQVERVAAALAVQERLGGGAEQRVGLRLRERAELDAGDQPVAPGGLERGEQAVRNLTGAERERDQHPGGRRAAQQVGDQLQRGVVGPVDVVEDEDDRLRPSPSAAAARARRGTRGSARPAGRRRRGPGGRRQHARELGHPLADQRLQAALAQRRDVVVQRVDPDRERQIGLQLGAAADVDGVPAGARALGQLVEQPRLADAGLAGHDDPARAGRPDRVERRIERRELLSAADEPLICLQYRRHLLRDTNQP